VFLGAISAINWFAVRYDKRWDFTEEGVYSLSLPSTNILNKVKKPLKIVGFKVGDWEPVRDLLNLYKNNGGGLVTTDLIDPRSKPHLVDKYNMKPGNLVYISYGEAENTAESRVNETTEEAISNAILKLVRGEGRKVYYLEGHGEPALTSKDEGGVDQFIGAIRDQQIAVESLIAATKERIPEDAAAVMVVAPKKPLLPQERAMLIDYAKKGGRLLLFTDPLGSQDVADIANEFGIEVGKDVILDQVQRLMEGPALAVQFAVQEYGKHPITSQFGSDSLTVVELASSVRAISGSESESLITELAKSSSRSFALKRLEPLFNEENPRAERSPDDINGPVSFAVAYEKKLDSSKSDADKEEQVSQQNISSTEGSSKEGSATSELISRVVVSGDSDIVKNRAFNLYSNRDLALNMVNWVAGEEGGVTIKPKALKVASEPLPASVFKTIFVISFLIPEIVLLFGLFVWFSRREVSLSNALKPLKAKSAK
jgi:ABC-type uncharacterized transport system involved in gliding motility auxiliary subunit